MEFHIDLAGERPDLERLRAAIGAIDPAALLDRDALGQRLRIAASLGLAELLAAAAQAGWSLSSSRVQPQPSTCCGGCGG